MNVSVNEFVSLVFSSSVANDVIHSALRKYYLDLLAQYKVYEDHYKEIALEFLSVFNCCKFLLRQFFDDDIVRDEKYTELPF